MDLAAGPMLRGFGGVTAIGPDGRVDLGGPKQRGVLALLLLDPGSVVSLDRMVDRLWNGQPPARAEVSVRGYVSRLRRALGEAGFDGERAIVFRDRGYVLDVPPEAIDLHRFDALVDRGVALVAAGADGKAGGADRADARRCFEAALELHAGPPLGRAADELGLTDELGRYEERRGAAIEALTDLRLAAGEHAQVPVDLASEIARQPYRERLRAQLALALYRAGRPVDALRSIDEARRALADDIGVDPGPELRSLEAAILAHDEAALRWTPPMPAVVHDPSDAPEAQAASGPVERPGFERPRFGRQREADRVRVVLDRLPVAGGVLVVAGEAGIGKSTLLDDLRVEAGRRGIAVGWDRCPEEAAGAPYRSWSSAVGGLLPPVDPAQEPSTGEEASGARLAMQLVVLDRLRARTEPAVVVIDDLQWADDATLALLAFLGPDLGRLRVLLAVAVRRPAADPLAPAVRDCLGELARTPDPVHLTLGRLHRDDVAAWVAAVAGRPPEPELVDHVADTTDGNPFFVQELLALLDAEGRLHGAVDLAAATVVPHAVQDVVRRRTSRLPPESQALLTVAAVVGRRFDLDVLAGVVELAPADALSRIEPALDAGLVVADEVPGRFAFAHALVSGTLVEEQNAARRTTIHARTTEVLEVLRAPDLDPWIDDLAHHAFEGLLAGTAPKALRYARQAAGVAAASRSAGEVARHLRRALAAAAQVPDFPVEDRQALLRDLGLALRESGDVGGRAHLVDAARLADARDDVGALAEILGGLDVESLWAGYDWNRSDPEVVAAVERALARPELGSRDRAVLTSALAAELTYLDNRRSQALFAEAYAAVEPLGDVVDTAQVLLRWFWSVSGAGGLADRVRIGDHLRVLDDDDALPDRLRPLAHLARVSSALEVGDADLARACVARARALAHPVRTPTGWSHLQYADAGLALLDGDLARARSHTEAVRVALRRVRPYTADTTPASIHAVIETEAGNHDVALEWLAPLIGSPYSEPIRWLEAWILAEAGRGDETAAALDRFDGPLPDDWLATPMRTAAINAAATIGHTAFLRRHLPALEPLAGRFAFVGEGGCCLGPVDLALGAGHHVLGDTARATTHAAAALAISRRMGAVRWVDRAERLVAHLSTA